MRRVAVAVEAADMESERGGVRSCVDSGVRSEARRGGGKWEAVEPRGPWREEACRGFGWIGRGPGGPVT